MTIGHFLKPTIGRLDPGIGAFSKNRIVLLLPFWELEGISFMSRDVHGMPCTTTRYLRRFEGFVFDRTVPDYGLIPARFDQLDFTTEDWSFIVRFKVDDITPDNYMFCRGAGNTDGWRVRLQAGSGALGVLFGNAGVLEWAVGSGCSADAWCTLGFSRSGPDLFTYREGVEDTTATSGVIVGPGTSPRSAKIGVLDDLTTTPFDGIMEFLVVFQGALTEAEHLAWHNILRHDFRNP